MRRFQPFLLSVALCSAALLPVTAVRAQEAYPNKPVRVLIGFAPGGYTDLVARIFTNDLKELMGQ